METEEAGTTLWDKLPVEVSDFILAHAARESELVSGIIPCVCHLWKARKPF